jgi:hypothetical protein
VTGRRARTRAGLCLAVVAALTAAPLVACSDDGPSKGEASLRVAGTAVIEHHDGSKDTVTRRADVTEGDHITVSKGTARLDLGGGSLLELRAGVAGAEDTQLLFGAVPTLESGDLLATTEDDLSLSVDGSTVRVSAGSARTNRGSGLEVAAYDADVHLDSAGQERDIPALREMQVPALGHPPETARPVEYRGSDPWDRRFLGDAIDLGTRLQALSQGYTQNLPAATPRTPAFLKGVLPGLVDDVELTSNLIDVDRPLGETLIGAAIVDLGRRGSFVDRWHSVFDFRDAGAAWGIVALDQGVDRGALLGAVTGAVDSSPLTIGPPSRRGGSTTTTTGPAAGSTTPTTTPRTTPTTRPTTPTTLATPGEPDDDGGLLGPIVQPVTDLLAGLLNGLLGGLFGKA